MFSPSRQPAKDTLHKDTSIHPAFFDLIINQSKYPTLSLLVYSNFFSKASRDLPIKNTTERHRALCQLAAPSLLQINQNTRQNMQNASSLCFSAFQSICV